MLKCIEHSIYAALLLTSSILVGCDGQQDSVITTPEVVVPLQVYAEIEDSNGGTRAAEKTAFAANDAIGVTCSTNTSMANNTKYTYSSSKWSTTSTVKFSSASTMSFKAYYPYVTTPTTAQTTEQDWLYATATASNSSPTATFSFKHMMSKLTITLSGFSVTTCTVSGLKSGGSFTPSTGAVAVATSTSSDRTFTSGTAVVLFPQTSTTALTVYVTDISTQYKCSITISGGIKSGYSYTYTITKP
jgi:hypothetical protein